MVKTPECNVEKVSDIIQSYVPEATIESNVGAEISYILPQESSGAFEGLFTELENNAEQLGVASFGASVTTLEEVFLKWVRQWNWLNGY